MSNPEMSSLDKTTNPPAGGAVPFPAALWTVIDESMNNMQHYGKRLLAAGLGCALLAGGLATQAADQDNNQKNKQRNPSQKAPPTGTSPRPADQGTPKRLPPPTVDRPNLPPVVDKPKSPAPVVDKPNPPSLVTTPTAKGYEKAAPSGRVRERVERKPDGEHVQKINAAGRLEKEMITKPDGTLHATTYDLGHREKRIEVARPNGAKEITDVHYDRNGQVRARETIQTDVRGAPVSKTVVVKNNLVINNTTINNTTINNTTVVREYRPCRFGFVYAPVVIAPAFYAGWYDPFWYSSPGILITTHSFSFSWGWAPEPWYVYHRAYWEPYPVYVGPSYWV